MPACRVRARFPEARLIGASSEKDGDKLIYEIELEFKGLHHDVTLETNGALSLIEREIAFAGPRGRLGMV